MITEYVKRRNFCENTTLKSITCEICKIACKRQDKSEFVFFFVKICEITTGFDGKSKHIEMNENYDSDENVNEIDNDEIELDDDDLDEDLEDSESMLEPQVNINYNKMFTLFSLGNPSI